MRFSSQWHKGIALALLLSLSSFGINAETREWKHNDVVQILNTFEQHYVFPEIARKEKTRILNMLAEGKLDHIPTMQTLLNALQSELRKTTSDGHISIHVAPNKHATSNNNSSHNNPPDNKQPKKARPSHIVPLTKPFKVEHELIPQSDNQLVAYLKFDRFTGAPNHVAQIESALNKLLITNHLIIDLTDNPGGDPNTVALIASYFLPNDTHLWSIKNSKGETTFKAYSDISTTPLDTPYLGQLYILTSSKTYSAAEAFAYTLKHLGRAQIIGETSSGGAHLVEMIPINERINFRMPVARAYNQITKTNWEGQGILPHIVTEPEQAKQAALKVIRASIAQASH